MLNYKDAVGPAILEFKGDKGSFSITNNIFALPSELLELTLSLQIEEKQRQPLLARI